MPKIPSKNEIRSKAIELWMKDIGYKLMERGEVVSTPTDEELREGGYWEKAKRELMTTSYAKVSSELEDLIKTVESDYNYYMDQISMYLKSLSPEYRKSVEEEIPVLLKTKDYIILRDKVRKLERELKRSGVPELVKKAEEYKRTADEWMRKYKELEKELNDVRRRLEIVRREKEKISKESAPPYEVSSVDVFRKWVKRLEDFFITSMIEKGFAPTTARRYLPVFRTRVVDVVIDDLSRGLSWKWIDIEKMVSRVVEDLFYTKPPKIVAGAKRVKVTPSKALELYGMAGAEAREKYFKMFLEEMGVSYDHYLTYHPVVKMQLEADFMRWLSKKLGLK